MKIQKIERNNDIEGLAFPIVSSSNKYVQDKINILLQLSELELIKGHEQKDIFEQVSPTYENRGGLYGSKVNIIYNILTNSSRNFAVKFDQYSCGMTCTTWVRYYNFNPQNGDRYALPEFFTDEGFQKFKGTAISKLQHAANEDWKDVDFGDKNVNAEFLQSLSDDIEGRYDFTDFYFTNDSIYMDYANLLSKNERYGDIHTASIAISEIKDMLNDFGKSALLTGENLSQYQSKEEPQLYEGAIGNSDIYLLMQISDIMNSEGDSYCYGIYAYKKYGKGIDLWDGKCYDGEFWFSERFDKTERNEDGINEIIETEEHEISFTKTDNSLKGFWKNSDGTEIVLQATRK